MAYNHGREDRKWRIWKEAEEKLLRECGVDEATIEQIRMADRADFNSNRRFYRWTNELGCEYLYIVPDLSGHGEAKDDPYVSTAEEAATLAHYLKEHDLCTIKLAFGASLGGGVLFELLQDQSLHFQKLFFEGTSFCEQAGLLSKMLEHVFLSKQKKARQDPKPLIDKVAKRYGIYANMLFDTLVTMDKQSIKNIVYDCGHIRLPHLSEDTKQDTIFSYGDKNLNVGHARRSIKKHYPKEKLKIWQGYGHCEEMTQNTVAYMAFVKGCVD